MDFANAEEQKEELQLKVANIRSRIDNLITDNKTRSSLECLSIEEFVIDKEKETLFLIECNERLEEASLNIK